MPALQSLRHATAAPPNNAERCARSHWQIDVVSADEAVRDSLVWRLGGQGFNCRALADLGVRCQAEEGSECCVLLDPGIEPAWLARQVTALADAEEAPRLVLVLEPALDELLQLLGSCRVPLHGLVLPFCFDRFEATLRSAANGSAANASALQSATRASIPFFV